VAGPIAVTAELLINGTFTDISAYIYLRDAITIDGGRQDEAGTPSPATLTLTLNNRDGRFTPNYTGGAYYPNLVRDTQIRLTVTYQTSTGNFYQGYRFWGKVPSWPPLADISGRDIYVSITASGPLRQVRQFGGKGSALARYYASLTGSFAPIAYWPCEEDSFSTLIGPGVDGGQVMTVTTGAPVWNAKSDFNGSAPIGVLNNSTWDGLTGSFGTSGDDVYLVPGTYQWVASTATVDARSWGGGGGGNLSNGTLGAGAGGGGEFAKEATLAVTPGTSYTVVVGAGGNGGSSPSNGHISSMAGDSVTVTARGGVVAGLRTGGAGGTGSANTVHHDGGAGGSSTGSGGGGGGGGGSGGTAAAGNAGGSTSTSAHGTGATAVTGGGKGGDGGDGTTGAAAVAGGVPGGGGGGGRGFALGAAGGAGKVELIYTPGAQPSSNVIRFILWVPAHGGNNGKVILRALTGGTLVQLDCLYVTGGKIQLKGYTAGPSLAFTSGNLTVGDGQTAMVSIELATSGANVAWKLRAITPGATSVIGTVSGTQTTATVGNVSEVLAAPNADITKTAAGHISVQYALIDLTKVSKALDGHRSEMGIDRFIRLCNEQAMDNSTEFTEQADHWGFRDGIQSWAALNGAVTSSTVWSSPADSDSSGVWSFTVSGTPANNNYFVLSTAQAASVSPGDRITISTAPALTYRVTNIGPPAFGFNNVTFTPDAAGPVNNPAVVSSGAHSLLLTANGGGQPQAFSPTGTAGQPVQPGDIVSAAVDVFAPVSLPNAFTGIKFFTAAGASLAETDSADIVLAANTATTMTVTATAPATAAFFNLRAGDHNTDANLTLLYIDNVRVHPRMGPQTRKEYHKFLEEIEFLDQGILREARHLHGMHYRTRIRLINQTPVLTLDFSKQHLAEVPAPVIDDQKLVDDVVVHRHKGSKVRKTKTVLGTPSHRKHHKTAAEIDQQLLALAQHLLNLGTVTDERYPVIGTCLVHPAAANIMSAIAGVEIGDFVKIINLPFWYPSTTASQLVIGYHEVITPYNWTIEWNCTPESPYEITAVNLRRW
jgi:hypothetical protein